MTTNVPDPFLDDLAHEAWKDVPGYEGPEGPEGLTVGPVEYRLSIFIIAGGALLGLALLVGLLILWLTGRKEPPRRED